MSPTNCTVTRQRHSRDGEALRRYRFRYILRARRWVEQDKIRIDVLAGRLLEIGAYAGENDGAHRRNVRYSILRTWAKFDGALQDRFGWYRWTSINGWAAYKWLPMADAPKAVAS